METIWKTIVWQQLGAAIDMLENAIRACPGEMWSDNSKPPQWAERDVVGFWYVVYHTLFFLDLYVSDSEIGFTPPAPFNRDELDPAGVLPDRPFTKEELLTYLEHGREKCRTAFESMSEEKARERCGVERFDLSRAELLVDSLRHIQHHVGQLNLILRQRAGSAPRWVTTTTVS